MRMRVRARGPYVAWTEAAGKTPERRSAVAERLGVSADLRRAGRTRPSLQTRISPEVQAYFEVAVAEEVVRVDDAEEDGDSSLTEESRHNRHMVKMTRDVRVPYLRIRGPIMNMNAAERKEARRSALEAVAEMAAATDMEGAEVIDVREMNSQGGDILQHHMAEC